MNIFYTEVDKNLQYELNARGKTGFQNRSNKALDYMLGKIANVQIVPYVGSSSMSGIIESAILGGSTVQGGRYLPSGPNGYLANWTGSRQNIAFYDQKDAATNKSAVVGNAYLKDTPISDQTRRTGPYITNVDVTIGDHSMGLLNKATVNIVIPNVARDLDDIEEVYFRPGRYISINIEHPQSAVVTRDDTQLQIINTGIGIPVAQPVKVTSGLLSEKTLPRKERIKELYPDWDVDKFLKEISRMNVFRFEGLITSFDFSYTADGTVEASLSVTGTSNVYTDVSMYLSGDKKTGKKSSPGTNTENFKIEPSINTTPSVPGEAAPEPLQLNDIIYNRITELINNFINNFSAANNFTEFLLPFSLNENPKPTATDHFFIAGNQYIPKIQPDQIVKEQSKFKYASSIKNNILVAAALNKVERANALSIPASGSNPAITIDPTAIPDPASISLPSLTNNSTLEEFMTAVSILRSNNLITLNEETKFFKDLERALNERNAEDQRIETAYSSSKAFAESYNKSEEALTNYNRYITLGALIHVVNTYVAQKTGTDPTAEIIHSDETNFSNYYPRLVSTDPESVLFLPETPNAVNDMNSYGSDPITGLIYYKDIVKQINNTGASPDVLQKAGWKPWLGVYKKQNDIGVMFPSRIFINLEKIKQIIDQLTDNRKNAFTVKAFIASISQLVARCSGNAIDLKLVTYPDDQTKLILTDTKYLKSANKPVLPYSVPMFANHKNGSIVREFSFSAKLPENVKNLSYVLNQGDDVTEEQITPYMNFMYNAKNPELVNKALNLYKTKHTEIIQQLESARTNYGLSPGIPERKQALYKAVTSYIKYPTSDIRKSQQITAPIFPFEVEFTIDGINGLRYGDVLTFEALPYKYRVNTVFSIIGITHTVSTEGDWATKVNCIMRPRIE